MRPLIALAAVALVSGCGPDPLLGTFDFSMTGTDTQTAPGNSTTSVSGMGTFSVTTGKTADYLLTLAHNDSDPCVLTATRDQKGETVSLTATEKCIFTQGNNVTTATLTSGTLTGSEKGETLSVNVNYSWTGTFLGINFAGTGTRTYSGVRR